MDNINPKHYRQYSIDCIDITQHLPFCLGNTVKYIWRAGDKHDTKEDYKKALWYLDEAIIRQESTTEVSNKLCSMVFETKGDKSDMFLALYKNELSYLRELLTKAIH